MTVDQLQKLLRRYARRADQRAATAKTITTTARATGRAQAYRHADAMLAQLNRERDAQCW